MIEVYIFVLGLIFGSFFNVVGLRRPVGESIVKPPSHCPNCKKKLRWYELFPVISYLLSLGKCRACKEKISILYPVIELLTGTLFLVGYLKYGFGYEFLAFVTISSLLAIIFVSDFKYLIILDGPLLICSILIFGLKIAFFGWKAAMLALVSGIIMFLIMYLIKIIGNIMFKRESLGGGDIKLAFFIGIVLGLKLSSIALIVSCFLAFPYAIFISLSKKDKVMPFGPFLITGVLVVFSFMSFINEIYYIIFPI